MALSTFFVALLVGLAIISALVWFIVRQLRVDNQRQAELLAAELRVQEGRAKLIESIQILLKVVGTEELGWIEASIRIKVLLDRLSVDLSEHSEIRAFYTVYSDTEHIPTHEVWSALPKETKNKFRQQMRACETQHLAALKAAQKALASYPLQ